MKINDQTNQSTKEYNPFCPWVIIPAHNEETVISNTLSTLLNGSEAPFKVIVVCNGCTDDTADIVREKFPEVDCQEIEQASKAAAIRYAELLDIGFPRLYLDADIVLSRADAALLFDTAKEQAKASLILPNSSIDLKGVSSWVKAYYHIWYQSPFVQQQGFGCGAYMLNKEARSRFSEWPDLIADDGFVRRLINLDEINIVKESIAKVRVPKTLKQLVKVKSRSKYGGIELNQYMSDLDLHNKLKKENKSWLKALLLKDFLPVLIYLWVNLIALIKAKNMARSKSFYWLRDETSR